MDLDLNSESVQLNSIVFRHFIKYLRNLKIRFKTLILASVLCVALPQLPSSTFVTLRDVASRWSGCDECLLDGFVDSFCGGNDLLPFYMKFTSVHLLPTLRLLNVCQLFLSMILHIIVSSLI